MASQGLSQPQASGSVASNMRRCFICLNDQEPTDREDDWVDPCPCTLEAHQTCMLAWVADCERENKAMLCPVCKSKIELAGPWNPIVAMVDTVAKKFTRASPYMLLTGFSLGVNFSLQMYGLVALWAFAGRDAMIQFSTGFMQRDYGGVHFRLEQLKTVAVLINIAPMLLFSHMLPNLSNKIHVPLATIYAMFQMSHDRTFLTWPPTPQTAMATFPLLRACYHNLWREFVAPREVNLNRQLMGLPPIERRRDAQAVQNERNARVAAEVNGEGGIMGLLQNLLDALDLADDEGQGGPEVRIIQEEIPAGEGDQGDANDAEQGDRIMYEIVIEEDFGGDEEDAAVRNNQDREGAPPPEANPAQGNNAPQVNGERPGEANPANDPEPARAQPSIRSILNSVSNSLASALLLPAISCAAGELLRFALPQAWTTAAPQYRWKVQRLGLLQQQWGRSLVGGCMYVVLKDMLRVYTKSRKVKGMKNRRIKNVDRARRHNK